MILLIDNYDSFTYNLVQYLEELGETCLVFRNDQTTIEEIKKLNPDYIFISPGPGMPKEAGITVDVIKQLGKEIPIFGVCLGHQAIACAFGGELIPSPQLMHGKVSNISHFSSPLFKNVPEIFEGGRYHSWIVDRSKLPDDILITAETESGEIMAIRHRKYPIEGVQFHPESILTPYGKQLILNFLQHYRKEYL